MYKEFFNDDYTFNIPQNFNFTFHVLDKLAEKFPHKKCLVWTDDNGDEKFFDFLQMKSNVDRTVNYLAVNGIKKGDAVMLILRRRYEFWFFLLALIKLGAVAVPCPYTLRSLDLEYRIRCCSPKMIVTFESEELQNEVQSAVNNSTGSTDVNPLLVTVGSSRKNWKSYWEEISNLPFAPGIKIPDCSVNDCNDPMLVYFTSGTSGNPKMVCHDFKYPLIHIITAKFWQHVCHDGIHLSVAETGWAKSMWGKIFGQWLCGSAVFVYDFKSFNPSRLMNKIQQYGVSTLCATPTIYRYLVQLDLKSFDLSRLKYAVTAGESIPWNVAVDFYNQTGLKIREAYGQTETGLLIGNFGNIENNKPTIGAPNPAYKIMLIDNYGNKILKPHTIGEICADVNYCSVGIFKGYYKNQELTEKVFSGGIYHTGDLAYFDEENNWVYVSRKDDIIKSKGFRISPYEVESILNCHPAVSDSFVFGQKDERKGVVVKCRIVLKENYEPSDKVADDIIKFALSKTSSYKIPQKIEFVNEIQKTLSGKTVRNQHK